MKLLSLLLAAVGVIINCSLGFEMALSQNGNETTVASGNETRVDIGNETTVASGNETMTGQKEEEWYSPLLVNESMPGDKEPMGEVNASVIAN